MISKDSSEKFCNFADLIAAISLTSSKQRFDRHDLIRSKNDRHDLMRDRVSDSIVRRIATIS